MWRELRVTLGIMVAVLIMASPAIFAEPGPSTAITNYNYLAMVFHVVPTATPTLAPVPTITATPTKTPVPPPLPTATKTPVPPTPTRNPALCAAEYPTVCIPPPPPDLNCGDITFRRFTVLPPDRHNFDTDNDGIGCESG